MKVDLGRVAQEAIPEQIGAGLGMGVGNGHPLAPVAAAEIAAGDVHRLADDAFVDQADDLGIVVVGHVLRADLHQALVLVGRLLHLAGPARTGSNA